MGEVIAFPKRAPAPEWIADVDAALSLSLDGWNKGFGWRPLPAGEIGQRFWRAWRDHKEVMKEAGFHVWREQDGVWGVLYRPRFEYCEGDAS